METAMTKGAASNKQTSPSLEERIGAIFTSNGSSEQFAALIAETESAISAAEANVLALREKAADMIAAPTAREAQDAMKAAEAAELELARLRGALPKLQQKLERANRDEEQARFNCEFAEAKAERDRLADEFEAVYSRCVTELLSLFKRMTAFDQRLDR
jgi:hypothetical protein